MKHLIALLMAASFDPHLQAAPEIPGAEQRNTIAIVGATIHRVSKPELKDATIVFDAGRITAIGRDTVIIPDGAKIIKADGKHVYPGLFNTDGVLGLIEINAVHATDDRGEVGSLNMNVRAEKAINPDSELIPVTRSGGVLVNLTAPNRGLIAGTSAILQLDGWTTEDLTLHAPAGMHIRWPSLSEATHHAEESEEKDRAKQRDEELRRIEEVFENAVIYRKARKANRDQPVDLRWEAMLPVLSGEVPLIAAADRAAQIQSAVAFASRRKLRLIIYGGNDAGQCAKLLQSQDIPVIVSSVYRLPLRRDEPYDHPFTLPERLQEAGVNFCIAGSGRFNAANTRNLPYHAAMAIAFGLSPDQALRAITLSPAEILGVADRVGSLDVGKHATLIVADGDIFHTATKVTSAFIQGRVVDLSDRHKRLYRKYQTRQRQQKNK